ncbi:MAG: flagellar hook-associated protein FlgL [Limnobacter sp.]|nr:flagellar hook-associated protein FlgL [Limnobacter sp.]
MRVSTQQFFKLSTANMTNQQSELLKLQGKLATGQDVQKPSDDPLRLATALGAKTNIRQIESYQSNINLVGNQLSQMDVALDSAVDVMQAIRDNMLAATNPVLSQSDRNTIVQDMQARLDQLRGIANRTDANGVYLFSGVSEDVEPFTTNTYAGETVGKSVTITTGRQMDLSITGDQAFYGQGSPDSVFQVVQDAIDDLTPPYTAAGGNLNVAISNFRARIPDVDNAYDSILLARTRVGIRQRELDTVEQINTASTTELERVAGEAVGLDYAKAISDLAQGQLKLQASQQSFSSTSQLSLFNFLN